METEPFYRDLPVGILYIVTVALVLLATEVGYRAGDLRGRRSAREKEAPVGGIVGATLGLLAFLLAFTFGTASTHYDAHKRLVLEEANGIATAYLRAGLLAEPQRTDARNTLLAYANLRSQGVTALLASDMAAQSTAMQAALWRTAASVGNENPDSSVGALFIEAVNQVIELDMARIAAGRNQIPTSIWLGLYFLAGLSMAAVGFQMGLHGTRSWAEMLLLVLAFALVIVLIADLDRPQAGLMRVSQQPLFDLIDKLGTAAAR